MSFIKNTTPQKENHVVSYKCCANNCPLNGTISTVQDKWVCSFHFRADSEKWPMVTQAIRDNADLFGMLDDLRKISEVEWSGSIKGNPPQREFYKQLFDDRPNLKPMDNENKSKYEYRLMDHISVMSGVLAKKQQPTFIQSKPVSKFLAPADYLTKPAQKPFSDTDRDHDFL